MSQDLNASPSGERLHIALLGCRNVGKSSLLNALTGQDLALVSPVKGTTTDPVRKAMELLPLGPVVFIDTPGLDDEGELGELRVKKAWEAIDQSDVALLVLDAQQEVSELELLWLSRLRRSGCPLMLVLNKCDISLERELPSGLQAFLEAEQGRDLPIFKVSALNGLGITELKDGLAVLAKQVPAPRPLVADLVKPGDTVVLVIPIDEAAPKGRLILPQQQTIRELLECGVSTVCCRETELEATLSRLTAPPRLVITDSQAFKKVADLTPPSVLLTSFSIIFARYKGDLAELVRGAARLGKLRDGDRVLISEGCTHHRQCNDIGSVKMPGWIKAFTGCTPEFSFSSGGSFPEDLSPFALVVHCGGCMLTPRVMARRLQRAKAFEVPIVNYGVAIAHMHGILARSLEPFPGMAQLLK